MARSPAEDPEHPLWQLKSPAIDRALAAALPTARPGERPDLIRRILSRRDTAAQSLVVAQLHTLDPAEARLVHAAAEHGLDSALRTVVGQRQSQPCRNALRLIRRHRLARLGYLLTELLRHGRDDLPALAADALHELGTDETLSASARRSLSEAVDAAAARFGRHSHPGTVDALLRALPAVLPDTEKALADADHPLVEALRGRLCEPADALSCRALLALLPQPTLSGACVQGLCFAARDGQLGDALGLGHLLADPTVTAGLRKIRDADALLLDEVTCRQLDADAARWLPALWSAMPIEPGRLTAHLLNLGSHAGVAPRVMAVRGLAQQLTQPLDEGQRRRCVDALAVFTQDAEESVAQTAARVLDRASRDLASTSALATMASARHASVRETAGRRLGPAAFARLWEAGHRLGPERRAAALRALRKLDPAFDSRLGRTLTGPADHQVRALGWVAALETPPAFDDAVTRLTGSANVKVAASAAATLRFSQAPHAADLLGTLTKHRNPRVRANAVEALDQRRQAERFRDRLVQLIHDDKPRPRANAIRALLETDTDTALRAMREMLGDRRPEHRRSARWLVDAAGLLDVAERSADTALTAAASGPNDAANAAATVNQMLADLYQGDATSQGAAA